MRQIVLDTETTGLDASKGHRIIEIGCVELINRKITGNNFHSYVNPEREVDFGALKVHGINNTFLIDKPKFKEILTKLMDYLNGAELIIHNATFDVSFINHEFQLANKQMKAIHHYCEITDTLQMARKRHPGQRNSLDALCKRYQIDNSHRDLHGALLDANILAQVYLVMTGGQTTLFGSTHEVNQDSNTDNRSAEKQKIELPIIHANATEQEQHQSYLQKLKQQSGECVWEEKR